MKNLFLACAVPMLGGCAGGIPALHSGAVALAAHASAAPIAAAAPAAGVGLGVGIVASDDIKRLAREAQDTQFGTQLAGTYGAMLQDAQTEVQSLVQTAMQQQREVLVVTGLQVQGAITRAQAAYRDKLSLKFERLGDQEKKIAADLASVVADLKSAADSTQKAAGDRAQRIAAGLRLPADAPQLASPGPLFLFSHLRSQRVTTRGRSPDSYAKSSVSELLIDRKSYKAFDYVEVSSRSSPPSRSLR